MQDVMLVMDFDHDTSRTVARMLRAERVNCKILPGDTAAENVFAMEPRGIVLAGAPGKRQTFDRALLENQVPLLSLGGMACEMVAALGGELKGVGYAGFSSVRWEHCPLFAGMDETDRMINHLCKWALPPMLMPAAGTADDVLAFQHMARPFYGLQLDMDPNAPEDAQILRNFAVEVCGCQEEWTEISFIESVMEDMRNKAQEGRALCCVTGGLDSALSAVLAKGALGERLQCLFVNTGFLRQGESDEFLQCCEKELELNVVTANEADRFTKALRGITDGDEKRRIFQETMRQVVQEWAEKLGPFRYFVKGTNCSDKMYSGASKAIAPGGAEVIEPLEDLFKPEIKQVAACTGMPDWFVRQQPFPSGGLAVRIVGEVDQEKLEILRFADHAFSRELNNNGTARRLYQYYAMLLPAAFHANAGSTVVLRAVQSGEGTVASAARLPYDLIETVTERILQENKQVAHVVYDMTPGNYFADAEW